MVATALYFRLEHRELSGEQAQWYILRSRGRSARDFVVNLASRRRLAEDSISARRSNTRSAGHAAAPQEVRAARGNFMNSLRASGTLSCREAGEEEEQKGPISMKMSFSPRSTTALRQHQWQREHIESHDESMYRSEHELIYKCCQYPSRCSAT